MPRLRDALGRRERLTRLRSLGRSRGRWRVVADRCAAGMLGFSRGNRFRPNRTRLRGRGKPAFFRAAQRRNKAMSRRIAEGRRSESPMGPSRRLSEPISRCPCCSREDRRLWSERLPASTALGIRSPAAWRVPGCRIIRAANSFSHTVPPELRGFPPAGFMRYFELCRRSRT